MYRKIYTADEDPPEPILHSAMGHSIARWEGETLVVETTHLRDDDALPVPSEAR